MTDVARISANRVGLRAGRLYAVLDRLRADGIIDIDREDIVDSGPRRYYKLTPDGISVLDQEVARMQANARAAVSQLNDAHSKRVITGTSLEHRCYRLLASYPGVASERTS